MAVVAEMRGQFGLHSSFKNGYVLILIAEAISSLMHRIGTIGRASVVIDLVKHDASQ